MRDRALHVERSRKIALERYRELEIVAGSTVRVPNDLLDGCYASGAGRHNETRSGSQKCQNFRQDAVRRDAER